MATPATKQDIQDLAGIIQDLATESGQRFDKVEQQIAELRDDFGRMLDLLDAHTKRLDDFMKEILARDARVDRLERWVKLIAAKTGVKLSS